MVSRNPHFISLWVILGRGIVQSILAPHRTGHIDIALDVAGNVYVAGAMWSENRLDYATTKYDPQGNEMWVARYHGPLVYGSEEATAIAVDAKGNVYVTGGSHPA